MEIKTHVFVGKSGYKFVENHLFGRFQRHLDGGFKYLGFFLGSMGWPKKLNTGRLLIKPNFAKKSAPLNKNN